MFRPYLIRLRNKKIKNHKKCVYDFIFDQNHGKLSFCKVFIDIDARNVPYII